MEMITLQCFVELGEGESRRGWLKDRLEEYMRVRELELEQEKEGEGHGEEAGEGGDVHETIERSEDFGGDGVAAEHPVMGGVKELHDNEDAATVEGDGNDGPAVKIKIEPGLKDTTQFVSPRPTTAIRLLDQAATNHSRRTEALDRAGASIEARNRDATRWEPGSGWRIVDGQSVWVGQRVGYERRCRILTTRPELQGGN
jgi:hypothetical protein